MSQISNAPDESGSQHVEDLVFRCLEATDFDAELDRLCAEHPDAADRLRRVARRLHAEGLLAEADATTHVAGAETGDAEIPKELGGFRLIRRLGVGGMGVVYLAEERALGREVAVKIVRPEQLYFPGSRERFRREVEAIARLQHPGIVTIYTVGEEDGIPFFSMDYVQGRSLAKVIAGLRGRDPARLRMQDGLQPAPDAPDHSTASTSATSQDNWVLGSLKILRALAAALTHAHEQGVLHRDVKPSNVILGRDGQPRLLDFGLARLEDSQELTKSTSQLGSLPYMPPEVVAGRLETPTPALDVYSLGVTMYELLTLRSPFLAEQSELTRERILRGECAPLRELNPAVSWEVQTVCATAMEQAPGRRYQTMAAFLQDLDNLLARRPILARPTGRLLRTCRWVQRHPTASVGIALATALVVLAVTFAVQQGILVEQTRRTSYVLGLTAADAQLEERRTLEAKRSLELCPEHLKGFEWHHLNLRADSSDRVFTGHEARVNSVDFHPDGETFISGSADRTIRIWSTQRAGPRILARLPDVDQSRNPNGNWVRTVRFSADGTHVFAGANDYRVRRLRADGSRIEVIGEHSSEITALAVDPAGRFVASGSSRGEIKLYDGAGRFLADLRAATRVAGPGFATRDRPVNDLVFAADGGRLFAGHMAELLVYDPAERRLVQTLEHAKMDWLNVILPHPDGRHLISGGNFGRLSKWDLGTGKRVAYSERSFVKGFNSGIRDAASGRLIVAGADGALAVCDPDRLGLLYYLQGHGSSVRELALSPDGKTFVSASLDHTVRRWRVTSRPAMRTLGRHGGLVRTLELSRDGRRAISGGSDGSVHEWTIATGARRTIFDTDADKVYDTSLSPDGRRLAVAADRVRVFDLATPGPGRLLTSVPATMKRVAWFPDGRRVLVAGEFGAAAIADVDADRVLATNADFADQPKHEARLHVVAVCPWDGAPLIGTAAGRLIRYDAETLERVEQLARFPHGVVAVTFDPVARLAVVGTFHGELRFVDVKTGRERRPPVQWDNHLLSAIELSPGRAHRRLVTSSMQRTIQVWDYPSMRRLLVLRGHRKGVFAVRFTPDGTRLLSTSWDKTVRVWETGRR